MDNFDNRTRIVKDDLEKTIKSGSRISIAAALFSIYAFEELKTQLENCEDFRFIFTSPTFIKEKPTKESREFYIPKLNREKSLYGTKFEVRLRNELKQKAIAQECAQWMRDKAQFKSIKTNSRLNSFIGVSESDNNIIYTPIYEFSTVDLGCERGDTLMNYVTKDDSPNALQFLQMFDSLWENEEQFEDVTDEVIDMISSVYKENSPELIYFFTLYNIFNEFLEDISEDNLANERTGFKETKIWNQLFDFQKDAALAVINKLEQYNGCILADSVGLGKTFTALAVIKYFESRNKRVLVLCPKKLKENWMTYRGNLINNPFIDDRFRYDVLYHTDLSREKGDTVIGLPIEQMNLSNYDLIVIDESHNFRNGIGTRHKGETKENRYMRLMNKFIKPGVETKVLMLSATPVNNRFTDLRNQLALAYGGEPDNLNKKLSTSTDIETIFRMAQREYNKWSKLPEEERTTQNLLDQLDFDFFEVLDSVTIARSRKHVQQYYDTTQIGAFPKRLKPISIRPKLTNLEDSFTYNDLFEEISKLKLTVYTPTAYILSTKINKYLDENDKDRNMLYGREFGIKRLMSINLLKRMESSVTSFLTTVDKILNYLVETSTKIEKFQNEGSVQINDVQNLTEIEDNFDEDDQNTEFFTVGKNIKIDLADMEYIGWKREIDSDIEILNNIKKMVEGIIPDHDSKLNKLVEIIKEKIENPINPGNKKVLIFTAFTDTAEYLYEKISPILKKEKGLNTALVTGSSNHSTIPDFKSDMSQILANFSPKSKDRDILYPDDKTDIDILIATDCISEGQNLQDCDYCINYDIHWNPVRIIQRFGRIDRIDCQNEVIQLVNFWPDLDLDEYINLKAKVETRMKVSVLTSTGDDDLINQEEKGDLEYRRTQLKKLQEEVVDLEDMSSGLSIMDLGLNEFRMDLLEYMKEHHDIEHVPFGVHAVVQGEKKGVIFILKNINEKINVKNQNRLHPFYIVFVGMDGEVITGHLQSKDSLDLMRRLSRGKSTPDMELNRKYNKLTKNGKDMKRESQLLENAISSIIEKKEEEDINSFFGSGQTTFLNESFSGLDDFELICFMVVV